MQTDAIERLNLRQLLLEPEVLEAVEPDIHLVTTLLGLSADAPNHRLELRPCLPDWLGQVQLRNLRVGNAAADVHVRRAADGRHELDADVHEGELEVVLGD